MIFIHTLRMMADLSVYFFLSELIVIMMGGSSQAVQFLLLSLCYGAMVFLQNRNCGRIYMLLPAAVLLVPGSFIPALLPPAIYILYLVYKENTTLSWDRQSELFSGSIKFFPIASVIICFLRKYAILVQYSLPMAFISVVTSIFLMRMLRQPPDIYMDRQYLRKNSVLFVIVLGAGWLLSRDFSIQLFGRAMVFVYQNIIYPVLNGFIWLFLVVLRLLMALFSWFKLGEVKFTENHLSGSEMGHSFKDVIVTGDHVATTQSVLTIAVLVLLLVCAFYFFRWLALHNGEETFISRGLDVIRGKEPAKRKRERATTTALQIRQQYRIFLKLYRENGGKMETASTSADVLARSVEIMEDSSDILAEMRQIYIAARYGSTATKTDLKRMKQINRELAAKNN